MLLKSVIIEKHFDKKIKVPCFFIQGKIDLDCDYFINKIKEECNKNDKYNYVSNVKGLKTSWNFLNDDKKFIGVLLQLSEFIDKNFDLRPYVLHEAWGIELRQYEHTLFHDHACDWSGVIYLNNCNQELHFPQLNQKVKPEPGTFAIFSGFLKHGCYRKIDEGSKFAISFNMFEKQNW